MVAKFTSGKEYSRKEIRAYLNIANPENIGGIWSTGYVQHEDSFFIFANISSPGRTGHDYGNILDEDILYWYTKNKDNFYVPTVQKMVSGEYPVHIFTRFDSNNPKFFYQGLGYMRDFEDGRPAFISWKLVSSTDTLENELVGNKRKKFIEGKKTSKTVNVYERNPQARTECLEHYGYSCKVCNFNFGEKYGDVGKNFIHVHHERELSLIGQTYEIDPILDMKPVCPNCHAVLHKRKPAYSIEELREMLIN